MDCPSVLKTLVLWMPLETGLFEVGEFEFNRGTSQIEGADEEDGALSSKGGLRLV